MLLGAARASNMKKLQGQAGRRLVGKMPFRAQAPAVGLHLGMHAIST